VKGHLLKNETNEETGRRQRICLCQEISEDEQITSTYYFPLTMKTALHCYLHGVDEHAGESERHFFGVLAALHRHFETIAEVYVHHLLRKRIG